MASGGRPHQRGLAAEAFARFYLRARIHQQLCGVEIAAAGDQVQHGLTVRIRRVGIRAGLQQQPQQFSVARVRSELDRVDAVVIYCIGIGTRREQALRLGNVAFEHRPLQRRAAIGV